MTRDVTRQFVILHHTGCPREHWDVLLDDGERLATWQLYHDPLGPLKEAWELSRIGDHRRAYLTYEGQLSGDRGRVRRVCAGRYRLLDNTSSAWRAGLEADASAGAWVLERTPGGWVLRPADPG